MSHERRLDGAIQERSAGFAGAGAGMRAVILDGIVVGLAFGLLGVGMTLVYGLGGVINLAYGQIVVFAAIVASLVIERGHSQGLAAVVGVLAVNLGRGDPLMSLAASAAISLYLRWRWVAAGRPGGVAGLTSS